ncbi:glucokinase [Ochromonadaceae sp. CCMP2298]|nr:glucokinase [Ochromonadaceae sp. CCMP2298]|mmetsp:Transcript_20129/g.44741  ORF Transcript_20129/g.44741 Transcript_20129/m.44741 type:complete len:394 (-) Transcript_20129:94-1275(-)
MTEIFLSADIGGTNTRLRLYEVSTSGTFKDLALDQVEELPGTLIYDEKFFNEEYASLLEVLKLFLQKANAPRNPTTACLAVAGPVNKNCAQLTNRSSWDINGATIAQELGLQSVRIINDFVAMGYGLLTLNEQKECVVLQAAPKQLNAPIACIGAGTGLGQCFLTPTGSGYECYPSEGGHAEFAPRNALEIKLLQYLSEKFKSKHRISIERLVSGQGLANIYEFLALEFPEETNDAVHEAVVSAGDAEKGRIIATSAGRCKLCAHTMQIFTAAYGAEAGVAALKWLPLGGLYLTGGLTPKNIAYVQGTVPGSEGLFMGALLDKGRVSGLLRHVPIYAVMVENLGERGAQYTALRLLQEVEKSKGGSGGGVSTSMVLSLLGACALIGAFVVLRK